MKREEGSGRYEAVDVALRGPVLAGQDESVTSATERPQLADIVQREGEFLWLTLQRLGIRRDDCQDVVQNVLLIVHKKLHTYDGRAPLRAWLYGICVKEASNHKRRAYVRRERPVGTEVIPDTELDGPETDPEHVAEAHEEQARVEAMLDAMTPEKRAVLVMYEVEERSCEEIATIQGVPVGTVHSRLHAARNSFRAIVDRFLRRESRGGRR